MLVDIGLENGLLKSGDGFNNIELDDMVGDYMGAGINSEADFWGKKQRAKRRAKREKRKAEGKPVGILNRIGSVLSKHGINPIYAPIWPFKGLIRNMLKKKGYTDIPKKIKPLAEMFYRKFIAKKNEAHFAISATAIVSAIVALLRGIKNKAANEPDKASKFEIETAKVIERVELEVETKAIDTAEEKVGEKVINFIKTPLGIASTALASGLVVYGIIRMFGK